MTKLSENEFDDVFYKLCRNDNDIFFKDYQQKFSESTILQWPEILEKLKLNAHVQDAQSVEEYIRHFNAKNHEQVELQDMRKESEVVDVALKESGMAPNNLQYAIAQSSIALLDKYPQQIHVIAGGQGKSRVAATMAFLAMQTRNFSKVHFVFTNNDLLMKDKSDYENLWTVTKLNDRIVYHHDIEFQV